MRVSKSTMNHISRFAIGNSAVVDVLSIVSSIIWTAPFALRAVVDQNNGVA